MLNAGLRAVPSPMSVWPIPGDVPDLQAIVHDQALTIQQQAALVDAYQAALTTAQTPVATTAQGTAAGTTTLTLAAVTNGPIRIGQSITGTGVTAGTVVTSQQSGTPASNGVYTTNNPLTLSNVVLTFTPNYGTMPWPAAADAPTLTNIQQTQTGILRTQSALLQQYQDLLNISSTSPPPTGP
jgi:hypothetical protein